MSEFVLLTTRPRGDGKTFSKDSLERMAADLNAGKGTCHPLRRDTVTARVVASDGGHFELLVSGELEGGLTR